MAQCAKCGASHNRFRNLAHTKPASYCCGCHAKHMRENRPKHSALPLEQRRKANVRATANVYLRRGKIEKMACLECGAQNAEKHHPDYNYPLLIEWLCRSCHVKHHHGLAIGDQPMVLERAA